MATRQTDDKWAIRCEGCDRVDTLAAASTAQEAITQAAAQGWARPRPGLSDYCPTCTDTHR